eukprot:GHVL01042038.1.p1 GENE.GHVL01042038.1~~GHVL01042038.1.p1  ORF type:complete len:238 (+),score=39.08 GHVL01042038.1:125-838(+)
MKRGRERVFKYRGPKQCGFLPYRGEFTTEYQHEIECVLAEMGFCTSAAEHDEMETWRELETKQAEFLNCYQEALHDRNRRRNLFIDHNIVELPKHELKHEDSSVRTVEEIEFWNIYRPLMRFLPGYMYENFIQTLLFEQRLRSRIEQLLIWRFNGCITESDGLNFEFENLHPRAKLAAIDTIPFEELLDAEEIKTCRKLHLAPQHFFLIKKSLLNEYERLGGTTKQGEIRLGAYFNK